MKRMSIGMLTAAASGLALGQAAAATKPHKTPAPPPPPPAYRWTGFYVGGHLGGGWSGNDRATATDPTGFVGTVPTSFSNSGKGSFIGGAQVGYNWQSASPLVIGVEGDWTGVNLSETAGGPVQGVGGTYTSTLRRNINSLFSVRGRVGYAADAMLYYFTAGGAWGRTSFSANTFTPGGIVYPTAFNNTAQGYVLGGGLE